MRPATFGYMAGYYSKLVGTALALMAVGALLRVIIFGRHAEHVVTLNTNAVQSWLPRRRSFLFWDMSLCLGRFRIHDEILAWQ